MTQCPKCNSKTEILCYWESKFEDKEDEEMMKNSELYIEMSDIFKRLLKLTRKYPTDVKFKVKCQIRAEKIYPIFDLEFDGERYE